MVIYPTVSTAGKAQGWGEPYSAEAVRHAKLDTGYNFVSATRTFDPKTWVHVLRHVSVADMETLRTFYETNKAGEFWWPHPSPNEGGLYYHVQYKEEMVPEIDGDEDGNWMISEVLEQLSTRTTLTPS